MSGADDGIRTRDPNLGKVVLYQLSHVRAKGSVARGLDLRKMLGVYENLLSRLCFFSEIGTIPFVATIMAITKRALSSGGERFLDTEEVRGSNPLAPTISTSCQYDLFEWTGMFKALTLSQGKRAGRTSRVRRFLGHVVLYLLIWLVITGGDLSSLFFGVPFSIMAAVVSTSMSRQDALRLSPLGIARFLLYFMKNSLVGGVDVALRAIRPSMPLNPGFINFEFRLPCDFSRALLCDTVSLLPGTLSAGFVRDSVYLHVLDVSQPVEKETRKIEQLIANALCIDLPEAPGDHLTVSEDR